MSVKVELAADGVYLVTTVNDKTGAENTVKEHANKALLPAQVARAFSADMKASGTLRDARLTFLGLVYAQQTLRGFAGSADKETGKVSNEFKAAVRSAEEATIRQMLKDGDLKLKDEPAIQAYLSALRDDKNYSNAKVTTNRYFGILGQSCVTKSGFIVPVPVMTAQLANAVPKKANDNSYAARLRAIIEDMNKGTITSADAIDAVGLARLLTATLEGIVKGNAEVATQQHQATGVVAHAAVPEAAAKAVDTALASAKATLADVKASKAAQAELAAMSKAPNSLGAALAAKKQKQVS